MQVENSIPCENNCSQYANGTGKSGPVKNKAGEIGGRLSLVKQERKKKRNNVVRKTFASFYVV